MVNLEYNLGCRNCLNGDNSRTVFVLMDEDEGEYKKQTEYQVMKKIESLRANASRTCPNCGSSNVEVLEIGVNDYSLYNFNRLVQECKEKNMSESNDENIFMLNMDKRNSQIKLNVGGTQQVHNDFLKKCLMTILDTINQRPADNFKSHQNGNFFICITGGFNFDKEEQIVKVERFRNVGLNINEIINQIESLASTYKVSIKTSASENIKKKSWWNF